MPRAFGHVADIPEVFPIKWEWLPHKVIISELNETAYEGISIWGIKMSFLFFKVYLLKFMPGAPIIVHRLAGGKKERK